LDADGKIDNEVFVEKIGVPWRISLKILLPKGLTSSTKFSAFPVLDHFPESKRPGHPRPADVHLTALHLLRLCETVRATLHNEKATRGGGKCRFRPPAPGLPVSRAVLRRSRLLPALKAGKILSKLPCLQEAGFKFSQMTR
jgi:hypothetical protein